MGELSLLQHFRDRAPRHPAIRVGPGSDCAVLSWPVGADLTYKIDQIVEGTHFTLDSACPRRIGWKAVAKACSDLAAAGSWPVAMTAAVNLRKGTDEHVALELFEGIQACCERFAFGLAGGDFTVSENGLSICVSMLGECPAGSAWTRAGGKPGDRLFVTGALGGSLRGKHLDFVPRLEEARAIRKIAGSVVHACIDITDGLARDLHHLCDESACGAELFADRIPLNTGATLQNALQDGEDFELLFAVEAAAGENLARAWAGPVPLTEIGILGANEDGRWMRASDGTRVPLPDVGYEHCA